MRMKHYEMFLRNFNFDTRYRSTKEYANADCMSRLPERELRTVTEFDFEESDIMEINLIETQFRSQ